MDNLEPITREEMLLDGQDLEPITRKEMFIRRIYDKTQVVPKPITREEMFLNKAGEGGGGDITIEQLNVTQNGTYSESGKAYSPVVVNVPTPPIPENAYLLNNLSGLPANIASFTDGTDLPMASLKVAVTPYQDLHGYDGPWAGGAGKNKLKYPYYASSTTINGVTFTVNDDGTVKVNGTASADASFYLAYTGSDMVLPQGEYTLNGCPSGGSDTTYMLNITNVSTQDTGSGANFTSDGTTSLNIRIIVRANTTASNLLFKPMIRLSSVSDATFAPYSNICPIIGWDEAVVSVSGINVWDEEWEVGSLNNTTGLPYSDPDNIRSKNYCPCSPNTDYYFCSSNNQTLRYYWYDADKNIISNAVIRNAAVTSPSNARFFKVRTATSYGSTYNNDISINYPSTDTSYHAYNGATYTIDLDGTRYGGTLDATDGTFLDMIDHIASYNGEELPPAWISDRDVYAVGTTPTIGAEVVYPRATPITVQLSPTAVKSLEGENNIFANCGDIIKLEYFSKEV